MSPNQDLHDQSSTAIIPGRAFSPAWTLAILATLIFLVEVVAMTLLYFVQLPNYLFIALLDGFIMLVLMSPALYFLQLRPLLKQFEERTRAEQNLRASEELLRKVLELLPVGVGIVDKNGMVMQGNPASQDIWAGVRYAGIQGYGEYKGWWPDTGKRVEPEEWAAARAITRRETSLDEEVNIEAFDGTKKVILNSAIPILDANDSLQGAVVVIEDITQRKQMQQALIQTNELLERIFASINTSIAYMDRDFNFIRVNDTYAWTGGHPPESYTGQNYFDLFPDEENLAIFQWVVQTGEPFSVFEKPIEYSEYPERGVTYWDWSLQPVKGAGEMVEGVVLSMVEVTERRRAQDQLAQRNKALLALSTAERRQRELAESLVQATIALNTSLELDQVIDTLLDHLRILVHPDCVEVTLLEDETHLTVQARRGYGPWADQDKNPLFSIGRGTEPAEHQEGLVRMSISLPNTAPGGPLEGRFGLRPDWNWLIVPIIAGDKVIGQVLLGRDGDLGFDPDLIQRAEALVGQGAAAIQNAWLFRQVRSGSERLQSLSRKLVEIQEKERHLIARELHDEAGQALSLLKLNLGRLQGDPDCPQHVSQKLEELKAVADGVLEELHRLAVDLRPTALDHLGLVAALEQHARNLNSDRLAVKFKALGFEKERLSKDLEIALYRIGQEALANVARHAQPKNVGILLERGEDWVKLFVEDDGLGFDPERPEYKDRLGLVGMRERAEMLGGTLTIESNPGKGTSIIVEVPDVYTHTYHG